MTTEPMALAFVGALADDARARFSDRAELAATLARLRADACAAYPDLIIDDSTFAADLARRLADLASPVQLAAVRAAHVHLAMACAAGDQRAIRQFETELFDEVTATGAQLRASPAQLDEVRSKLRHVLFTSEPGRRAAMATFAGRSDLRSYLRVVITRELVRLIDRGRRDVELDDSMIQLVAATDGPELGFLKAHYRADVEGAIRAALAGLADSSRALLRYSGVDGWSIDRIGALYGIHRATAARRVAAARDQLAVAIRTELAARLGIAVDEVDSIVRLVQSRLDVSLERLLE